MKPTFDFEVNTGTGECFRKRIGRKSNVGTCSVLPLSQAKKLSKGKRHWQERYRNFIAPARTAVPEECTVKSLTE